MAPLLQVEGLRTHLFVRAGVLKAVDDVSFSVRRGEVLGLVGESGSGKSALARSLVGLVDAPGRVVGGHVIFDTHDLHAQSREFMRALLGRRIGFIAQNPQSSLNPGLRIDEQMIEGIVAHGSMSPDAARERASTALVRIGIPLPDEILGAYPGELSDDLRQRVAIAMPLVHDPELIIADEPTTGLDFPVHTQTLHEMQRRVTESGTAVLWMARDLSMVAGFADRVGVMYAGRLVEEGAATDVLQWPAHPYTRGLIDAVPSRVRRGTRLRTIPGSTPSLLGLPSGCAFRERCTNAIHACVAAPEMFPIGEALGQRAVRCHNPLPVEAIVT